MRAKEALECSELSLVSNSGSPKEHKANRNRVKTVVCVFHMGTKTLWGAEIKAFKLCSGIKNLSIFYPF